MFVSGTHQMHFCARIQLQRDMCLVWSRAVNASIFWRTTYPADLARVASLVALARADSGDPRGDKTSLNIATKLPRFSAWAEEEEFSGHDFAQCGGFVTFPHFLHRSLSLFAFLRGDWLSRSHRWVPARTPTLHRCPIVGRPWVARSRDQPVSRSSTHEMQKLFNRNNRNWSFKTLKH